MEKHFSETLGNKRNRYDPTEDMAYTSIISREFCFDHSHRGKRARRQEVGFQMQDFAVITPSDVDSTTEDTESIHSAIGTDQKGPVRKWWKKDQHKEPLDRCSSLSTTCFICCNTFQGATSSQTSKECNTLLNYFSCSAKQSSQIKTQPSVDCKVLQKCSFCDRQSCEQCTRQCFTCQSNFCSLCSVVDYHSTRERYFCLDCQSSDRPISPTSTEEQSSDMQLD